MDLLSSLEIQCTGALYCHPGQQGWSLRKENGQRSAHRGTRMDAGSL